MLGRQPHDKFTPGDCCTIVCCGACMNPARRDRKLRAGRRYLASASTKVVALALLILVLDVYLFLDYFEMMGTAGTVSSEGAPQPGDVVSWSKAGDSREEAGNGRGGGRGGGGGGGRKKRPRAKSIGAPPKYEVCECDPNTAAPSIYVECAVGRNGFPSIQIKNDQDMNSHPRFTCGLLLGGTECGCCDCHHWQSAEGEARRR